MACPLGERKGRTRHRRVTTVSSTDIYIFLAPRSARRSDASNTAGRSAGGSLWRQREPGRKWRSRVQTPVAHAQQGWHRHLAPRSADRPDASDAAGRSAGGSRRRQREPGRKWRSRVQTPEAHAQPGWHQRLAALRASLGRLRRSRAVGGRKPAAPKAACQAAAPARSNAAWQWSSAKEPSADARSRARCSARTIVRGRDAPALPCHSACGAHLGPRPPKQPVWRVRTPPRMGERAPSRRALDHPHQPAARPECPSARPASRPPRLALDQALAYGPRGAMEILGRALSGS